MRKQIILFCFIFSYIYVDAQQPNLFLGKSYFNFYEKSIYLDQSSLHTSFKPLIISNLPQDVLLENSDIKRDSKNYLSKMILGEMFVVKGLDYNITVSPLFNFSLGKEILDNKNLYTNSRGYLVRGQVGSRVSFFSSFFENQSIFPNYLHQYIKKNSVVPGQGYARIFKEKGFDYAMSSGYFSVDLSEIFTLQFGHGKHFIGDGYRSLLLSDNSFNYPFLRIETNFGRIQYTNLYAEFQDLRYFSTHMIDNNDQIGFAKKYMSSHYLSINFNKRLNISLFESVIWRANHAPGENGFDFQYINPIALLRPIEFSINSPDNVLLGFNFRYNLFSKSFFYGQLLFDEFVLDELRNNNNFWANKFGYQLGYKHYDFVINNLSAQVEYNYVRPYTYAHHNPSQNHAHYNQPLAHPLGANFSELLLIADYSYKKLDIQGKLIFIKYGGKKLNDPISYGNDLYMSTGNYGQQENVTNVGVGRPSDYDIYMYQGNLTNITYKSLKISYLVNKKTNLKFNLEFINRLFIDENISTKTQLVNFGIQTDLFNNYYDF